MIKLRKPFSQKVQLHIRQDMLQRLWDKYVPTSSPEYEKIELVYLKGGPEEMERPPERIQLLLGLVLKNKMLQLNLMQYPAAVRFGQKQMKSSLQRMERYYAVQLKSADPAMYRIVRQYFTLLEQAGEENRRYQSWRKTNLAIEKQKDEYRLLSLFSEKLRERLTVYSASTLRAMEKDFVHSLSETEYRMLAEELVWQEKPELITYFNEWDESRCGNVVRELEEYTDIRQVLSQVTGQSEKEKLITAVERLGQREFCLFYHQITDLEDVNPQMVLWKESRTEMLHSIDQMESGTLQQLQKQIEDLTYPLGQDTPRIQKNDSQDQNTLQIRGNGSQDQNIVQIHGDGSQDQNIVQIQDEGSQDQEILRSLERELVYSLSEAEYQTLSEKNIWQEKPELIAYLKECGQVQCMEIVRELEKDMDMRQVLSLYSEQPVKERLIMAVEKMEQKEFCLFYHQVMKLEDTAPQIVLWKESRTEMLHFIDQTESKLLQQMWEQIERTEHQFESDTLREYEKDVQNQETLRTQEKEMLQSLLETEYQAFAERLIWQEKPELIAYFKGCEKAFCKEIIKQLEKDIYIRQVLSAIQKQSAKKKLIAAAYKLEQRDFCLFYWQAADLLSVIPQIVIWKKGRAEMLRSIDELSLGSLQKVWEQMEAAGPVQGLRQVFAEKMLHLQSQYQQNGSRDFQEQIAVLLEENDLAGIADIIDIKQLMQGDGMAEYTGQPAGDAQEPESGFAEHEQLVLRDGAYQVLRNLEHERKIRRESIEQHQMHAVETYQEVYHQIFGTKENMVQAVERIFREQHQEQLTGEEIRNLYEWSQAFLDVYAAQQGQEVTDRDFPEESSFSSDQKEQSELVHVIRQLNQYMMDHDMEEPHGTGEGLTLRWQEKLLKDERIQKLLIYIRELEEQQKDKFIHYLADMVQLSVQLSFQKKENTVVQTDRTKLAVLPMQNNQQESVEKVLHTEDREFARELLQVEDREFAERLLWLEDGEFARELLHTEDREFVRELLQIEDREFAKRLLRTEDRESAKRLLQIEDKEFARKLLQIEDRELARKLLHTEDREFVKSVLRTEDREFAKRLLQIEDRELARKLLQIEDKEFVKKLLRTENRESVGKLLQDSSGQLLDVSFKSLWEWGETLLYHPEHEQEREDADILSFLQQEMFFSDSDGAQQTDIQTQVIRRQIEMAKNRNHLQSLIRQINHQANIQLVYTDAQLRLPQVQTLLQYVRQLDERQYGVLVKELAQITRLQKLSYEEPEAASAVVHAAGEDELSSIDKENAAILYNRTYPAEQVMQGDEHESGRQLLRIEDKEFIEKLLHLEDKEFAEKLLQVKDIELAGKLLQVKDREFARRLLQLENEEFAKRLSRVEDRELAEKLLEPENRKLAERLLQVKDIELAGGLLQVKDRELVEKLLEPENRKLAEKLLQIENRESAEKLLQIENRESAEKLLQIENRESAGKLLEPENQESAERLLQIKSRESVWKLLEPENREFVERLLRLEDKELAERLLRIEDKEVVRKLLQDSEGQPQEVSYRNMWEWGEALLLHPEYHPGQESADSVSGSQQEASSSDLDDAKQVNEQTQVIHQRNHLQSLIGQINHQADVQLVYTEELLKMPQIQALLQYVRQLDVKQYGAFVRELSQVLMAQKLSYDEPETVQAVYTEVENTLPRTRTFSLEQRAAALEQGTAAYQTLVQYIQNYERQRQLELYKDIREIGQKIFPQAYRRDNRRYVTSSIRAGNNVQGTAVHSLPPNETPLYGRSGKTYGQMPYDELAFYNTNGGENGLRPYEASGNEYVPASYGQPFYETIINANGMIPYESIINANGTIPNETIINANDMTSYEPGINAYSLMPYEGTASVHGLSLYEPGINAYSLMPYEETASVHGLPLYEPGVNAYSLVPYEETASVRGLTSYDTGISEYGRMPYEETENEYAQPASYGRNRQESRYQPRELEYSVQKAPVSEEDQQRKELRMQQETDQLKSVQEQLDKKLKEVEHQLKKVEDNAKAKEDAETLAEQVKRQLYEELHVEKLRRGLI